VNKTLVAAGGCLRFLLRIGDGNDLDLQIKKKESDLKKTSV